MTDQEARSVADRIREIGKEIDALKEEQKYLLIRLQAECPRPVSERVDVIDLSLEYPECGLCCKVMEEL